MAESVLKPKELRILETLRLAPARKFRGSIRGERLSKQKGISIEFADFRNYADGDDLRHLDWNVLARLDTPVMRTYQDEEDLQVYLLLDSTTSMDFGEPSKSEMARNYAAAFGYVGLISGDSVRIKIVGQKQSVKPVLRGKANAFRLFSGLNSQGGSAQTESLNQALQTLLRAQLKPGVIILISDGLDPEIPSTIRALGGRGFEVWFLNLLSDADLNPDLEGDLRLFDSETDAKTEITINRDTLKSYQTNLENHLHLLATSTLKFKGRYELVRTSETLEEVIGKRLKRSGWFQ
jgi:uncharacterized protein (DUF58 family)